MTEPDKSMETMIANLEKNTGHDLDWWVEQVNRSGAEKLGEIVALLKSEHGFGHGYANLVAHTARERRAGGPASDDELVSAQYRGKEHLLPIYERLRDAATSLGGDVEVAPKKTGVSLRRSKQFALIEPATKTRIDLGLNLRGVVGNERLREAGGMCTHKVAITSIDDVDDALLAWLHQAYELA